MSLTVMAVCAIYMYLDVIDSDGGRNGDRLLDRTDLQACSYGLYIVTAYKGMADQTDLQACSYGAYIVMAYIVMTDRTELQAAAIRRRQGAIGQGPITP